MNTYTHGLAEYASGLQYERIPADVRERLKLLILDALGCALYGAELIGSTPEEFAAHIKAEIARVGNVVRATGIHIE